MPQFIYIWKYQVDPEYESQFLNAYKSNGTWVQLFKRSEGHLQTQLLKEHESEFVYLTIDIWENYELYKRFRKEWGEEFNQLDKQCENYTLDETLVTYADVA